MGLFQLSLESKGNYIHGRFVNPSKAPAQVSGEWWSISPADASDQLGKISYSYLDIDTAIDSARSAFESWSDLDLETRASYLRHYQKVLKARENELAEVIAREVGKPLWEARSEVAAMIAKVDITISDSMKLVADLDLPEVMPGTHGKNRYRPLGVMAVIGPFNFPGHLPNGHIVPALLTGNTVVFKPSEKTPFVGQLIAECLHEAGLPAGVFNLLQGEREVSRRLCTHEGVNGVLFTGSYEVGTRIKQDTLQQYWKLLALEMGGKNTTIIWKDADLEVAVLESLVSSFATTGQRCSCTSRILIHEDLLSRFVEKFHARAKKFLIGHPINNPFMGALIDAASVDRFLKFQGIAAREGAEMIMNGKRLEMEWKGNYITPAIALLKEGTVENCKKSVFQQTEIFAPLVSIQPVRDIEQTAKIANATTYGLVTSVFTSDEKTYHQFWKKLESGCVNWNKSTIGASSKLPFGGLKKSGNHFPTALTAPFYCTYPVASLEVKTPKLATAAYPGLNWD